MIRQAFAFCFIFLFGTVICQFDTPQDYVDYISDNLQFKFDITTNLESVGDESRARGILTFTNNGDRDITDNTWEIYFCSIRIFEPGSLRENPDVGKELGKSNLAVYQVSGCLHKLLPMQGFEGFLTSTSITAPFETSHWLVSRNDPSPNWYVTVDGAEARTLLSTAGFSQDFVGEFTTPEQWKRRDYDQYNPYSPEDRYELNSDVADFGETPLLVVPTPVSIRKNSDDTIEIYKDWVVVSIQPETVLAAIFLADKLGLKYVNESAQPSSRYIRLDVGEVRDENGNVITNDEAYRLDVEMEPEDILITGSTAAGLFYGTATVWSLFSGSPHIPHIVIVDYPRYPYRGMHINVSRNFITKESMLKLLEAMGMYKLNKLHFHLADDEGWRLEIPGLAELTEIGGYRCHDLKETTCVISQLGSGPGTSTSGSGFYTIADYKEMLQFANDRSIEVIPEFDMPGHGHAAIKAMEARYHSLIDTDPEAASEYLLSDFDDTSKYISAQIFRDNAINPCLNSTYTFIRKVVTEVKAIHGDIQPLQIFHFGGDEVPEGAWEHSPVCGTSRTPEELMEYFVYRVANIVHEEGLNLGGWEDGLMRNFTSTYDRTSMPNDEVYGYAWNNVWERGGGSSTYTLANSNFKAVISHATGFYLDMPYEPDPEERGYYWATRFTETRNTFNYMPDTIYENIEVDLFGRPLTKEGVCADHYCVQLEEDKRANVVGIQGQLWSETVRNPDQFDYMIFPRLLALAERGWHMAPWENIFDSKKEREAQRDANWEQFANTLGYKELRRLDDIHVSSNVPLPGAKISKSGVLSAKCNFPGLTIQYSTDGGVTWADYKDGQQMPPDLDVHLRTRSADMRRTSRTVSLHSPPWDDGGAATSSHVTWTLFYCIAITIVNHSNQ